ncbi:putative UDP-galactose:ceramide 1-beta-galactosyltransferase [Penicillium oxalicum 114-2]|uniref:Putative UDP-galactose:ceramide 1-beta-galactosyltransferase n=1 Tax=Penicillium oxalicum (strain 114-2 / CGMCC 5302) TaxID=933388 RepID=S7Z8U7_PENO1|nr:putative UDP-galactose:ceramide 1-beta-galactosyltransferase [Penicillium oxalicum 114-2]
MPARRILFLTNSELGQCNVALAVAEEFLRRGGFAVHIGSFKQLAPLVEDMNQRLHCGQAAIFHQVPGPSMKDLADRVPCDHISHRPGVRGSVQGYRKVFGILQNWRPAEYLEAYRACGLMIEDLRPNIVVIDPIFQPGLDVCRNTTVRVAIIWPVPLKDVVIGIQPKGAILCRYPATGSGFPFPVPLSLVLLNIFLIVRALLMMATAKPEPDKLQGGKRPSGRSPFPLIQAYTKNWLNLTPAFEELDFPLNVPNNVISCGPVLRGHLPLSKADAEIEAWHAKPTILISLGSHAPLSETNALQMAKAIQAENSKKFNEILRPSIEKGSVRIVSWIRADIMSILDSERVVAFVHHGGANSFFEACKAGVSQVVLPQWLDTYDCATRVEWLGIGVNGSRAAAPDIDAEELSQALCRVLTDENIRSRARAVKTLCKEEGRVKAHDEILEFCTQ